MIIVHGLEGSSMSQYVIGNAARAWRAGFNVVRMNMRNCGATEKLSPTLYHSGLSGDIAAVLKAFRHDRGCENFVLVGYSMGGNLVLKLAGELGEGALSQLKAVVGISPAMDLAASADALHEPWNRVYEWKFLRGLLKRFARKVELFPEIYNAASARGIRTLRDFDDKITAVYSGFTGADDYYARSSSSQFAASFNVPTLIIHSLDDPFVRMLPSTRAALLANRNATLVETAHGGHCAFLEPRTLQNDGYWAERVLLRFILSSVGN
jgi:predicted alpha/beta-fold hydrolase